MKQLRAVLILILDGVPDKNGDFFDSTTVITCNHSSVPVTDSSGYAIGTATLIPGLKLQERLCVDLEFFDGIKPGMESMQPCFMGKCKTRLAAHVQEAELTSVMISNYNADVRIPTIGYYLGIIPPSVSKSENLCTCERLLNGHEPGCGWKRKEYGQDKH